MTATERWYLVRTLSGREISAERQLQNQGYISFLPKHVKTIRHARKLTHAVGAYFPCYLFVSLDLEHDRWRSINGTFGVSHIITAGDRPAPVPEGVVEALVAASDERGVLVRQTHFSEGEQVRLIAGPFADQLGVIDRLDEGGRVRVLLELMVGHVPLLIGHEALARVG